MASRKNVLRLALVAALAALLSGCLAYGGGRYPAPYGGGYAYQGAYRQAPSGHAYHQHRHHKLGHRDRSAARERSGQPRHDLNAQAPRRDRRGSTDRKAEAQPAPAEDYGRDTEWLPGPTARDEGPRPGAEGGAR
ncbi:MAG: hypothetical protein IID48_17990 [Proteobacteria bacterium]|nr:hypothetical protein [Pseudomonadota bacterium]